MKSTRLWIADSDASYMEAFREYVNLKKSHLFQVRMCTEKEQLVRAAAGEEIEILLISAERYEVCKELIRRECVILLSDGSLPRELGMYPAVYKYQSVENILREIMYYYSEQDAEEEYLTGIHKDNRVIGVYTPAGGIGKNVFALTLGQILAANQNVLYLNLEECCGFTELLGKSHWNLSDLIYFLRQKNTTPFLYRLNSMVQKLDRMDYIPTCASYTDFRQVTVEEWQRLLDLIRTQSSYDSVILDLGNAAGHELDLLRKCDGIYVPAGRDIISQTKINQWQKYIQILDGMDILESLQTLELPDCTVSLESEEELLMLPQQELGHYIRGLLRE
ncbi:MAG: hypothetical protein KH452_11520 [Clostridiales bacterium]|nr:hypothetical protein [Clostridiales bacterium]